MDTLFWLLQVCIEPLFYLFFLFLFLYFFVKPLLNYLTVGKIIREEKQLQKEYREHKEKLKSDRLKEDEERSKKLYNV